MEEEYAEYIMSIKDLVTEMVPNTHWSFVVIQTVAIVYASVLNLIAPVIGGAIILENLASVFPKRVLVYRCANVQTDCHYRIITHI